MEFKISSALKDLIGKELITDDQTAIFELVKNAYDAQAGFVEVKIDEVATGNAHIIIKDNGIGMNKDDIENKWLFVGYSEKKEGVVIPVNKYKNNRRIFAGAKGIGRFSCDRLGALLTIYTKTKLDKDINQLLVFWDRFEVDQEQEFQKIEVEYHSIMIDSDNRHPYVGHFFSEYDQGTILLIESLNSLWNDEKKLQKLRVFLQRLINPAQIAEDRFRIFMNTPDFIEFDKKMEKSGKSNRMLNGEIQNFVFEKLQLKTINIDAQVNDETIVTKLIDKDEIIFKIEERKPQEYSLLHDIHVVISYLNTSAKRTFSLVMGMPPVEFGNIFLYKNGFRIHPCGEMDDDWLLISRRKQQGVKRHLGTRDVMGRVEVVGKQDDIREVTSRSGGLINTPTALQLISFGSQNAIRILERYVIEALNWESISDSNQRNANILQLVEKLYGSKIKEENKNIYVHPQLLAILQKKQITQIPTLIEGIQDQLPKDATNISVIRESLATLNRTIELQKREYERKLQYANMEVSFSRAITATDYNQILDYVHHILIQAGLINDQLNSLFALQPKEEFTEILRSIKLENDQVLSISKFLTKPNLLTKQTKEMRDIVLFFSEYIVQYPTLDDIKTKLKIEKNPESLEFPIKFRPMDITIIIDNIVSNSKKFGATEILFKFEKVSETELNISFIDNGKGLDKSITETEILFNKGTTTTYGSGIGLFSIKRAAQQICRKSKIKIDRSFTNGFKLDWEIVL